VRPARSLPFTFLLACGSITPPTESPAPVNVCHGTCSYPADAGAVTCATVGAGVGACQVPTQPPFVLIVTVSDLAPVSPGATYAIPSTDLTLVDVSHQCVSLPNGLPLHNVCYRLASLQPAAGAYVVSPSNVQNAGRRVSAVDAGASEYVTLPVDVTFWPQWVQGGTATDARYLSLPLPPVFALVESSNVLALDTAAFSPWGSKTPIEWFANLPPLPVGASYSATVHVTPPFDDSFPDTAYTTTTVGGDPALGIEEGTAAISAFPAGGVTVKRANGAPVGKGWTVFLRDPSTLQPISSTATLGPTLAPARLNIFGTAATLPAAVDIVLSPPAGSVGLPEFAASYNGTSEVTYPDLPPIVHVSGGVRSPTNTPVSATLLFFSSQLKDVATCEAKGGNSSVLGAVYESVVETADQRAATGVVGAFDVDLPQGQYVVIAQPTAASGYAKTVVEYLTVGAAGGAGCTGASPPLANQVVEVRDPQTVTGSVVTADGRPVANAAVDFTPAAVFANGLRPLPPVPNLPIQHDLWPRPASTTTGAQGTFSLPIDPTTSGAPALYDITVRPQDGTNFPWVVRPSRLAPPSGQFEPIVVPAPYFLSVSLEDPDGNALSNAVVQAFAFTAAGVAVAIGEATTDVSGHFTMMLSPSLPAD